MQRMSSELWKGRHLCRHVTARVQLGLPGGEGMWPLLCGPQQATKGCHSPRPGAEDEQQDKRHPGTSIHEANPISKVLGHEHMGSPAARGSSPRSSYPKQDFLRGNVNKPSMSMAQDPRGFQMEILHKWTAGHLPLQIPEDPMASRGSTQGFTSRPYVHHGVADHPQRCGKDTHNFTQVQVTASKTVGKELNILPASHLHAGSPSLQVT